MADRRPRALERERGRSIEQIEATGAPALLLERFAGRLEYHTPWSIGREVSHLFRGDVDLDEVSAVLDAGRLDGCGWSTTASIPGTPSRVARLARVDRAPTT